MKKPYRGRVALALLTFFSSFLLNVGTFSRAYAETPKFEVKATVDQRAIDPSEVVVLTVSVTSEEDVDVKPPSLPPMNEFEVMSQWQGSETRANLVNTPTGMQFKTVRSKTFNYQLSPKKLGALTIFPIEINVEGKSVRTGAIVVQVASGAGANRGGQAGRSGRGTAKPPPGFDDEALPGPTDDEEDLFSQLLRRGMRQIPQGGSRTLPKNSNEAFFVQVETDKTDAYVGEQITVSFFLYTTGLIRDLDTLKYPSLKGFWKEDIEIATHLNFQQEVLDGVPYKKALLASFALFPIKEGSATIDSYTAKCTVVGMGDPFGALGMGRAFTYTKSSAPVKIQVKALPTVGRPADFSGAVGDFQVTARLENNNVVANQPFPLKIRFEGRGNAKLIDIPPFQPPQGMELYDTQKDSKFFGWGTSFKEFTMQLIPRTEGEYTIPSISASMFDPQTQKYVTRTTEAMRLRVGAGAKGAGGTSESFTGAGKTAGKRLGTAGPTEPRLVESFKPESKMALAGSLSGAASIYIAVLAILLGFTAYEFGWGRGGPRLGRLVRLRVRVLDGLAKKSDVRQVGVRGVNLLAFTLGEVVGDRTDGREVMKLFLATPPSIQKECGSVITDVLQKFEMLAFAPETVIEEWKDPAKLRALINEASKAMDRVVVLSGSVEQSV
jgi:hypothetical protein